MRMRFSPMVLLLLLPPIAPQKLPPIAPQAPQWNEDRGDVCVGRPCGNTVVAIASARPELPPMTLSKRTGLRFTVMSAWSSDALPVQALMNHAQYATRHGYEYYVHWLKTMGETGMKGLDPGWVKVDGFRVLLSRDRPPDYIFYLDADSQFVRGDVRLEELVDPAERWSVYAQEFYSSLAPSDGMLVRGDEFGRRFVDDWWRKRHTCASHNREQGAYYDVIGLAHAREKFPNVTLSPYKCSSLCGRGKNRVFNDCYRNWLIENELGVRNFHPSIYFYRPEGIARGAPESGYVLRTNAQSKKAFSDFVPPEER